MRKALWAAAAATALVSTAAFASVAYDPATGGFAGKGDVQLALHMNNASFQSASLAGSIVFTYVDEQTYETVCTWTTGHATHTKTATVTSGVNATLDYDQRHRNQFLGFDLAAADEGTSPDIPSLGDTCSAEGNNEQGTYTSVDLIGSSGGGLYVNGVALPNTPTL